MITQQSILKMAYTTLGFLILVVLLVPALSLISRMASANTSVLNYIWYEHLPQLQTKPHRRGQPITLTSTSKIIDAPVSVEWDDYLDCLTADGESSRGIIREDDWRFEKKRDTKKTKWHFKPHHVPHDAVECRSCGTVSGYTERDFWLMPWHYCTERRIAVNLPPS